MTLNVNVESITLSHVLQADGQWEGIPSLLHLNGLLTTQSQPLQIFLPFEFVVLNLRGESEQLTAATPGTRPDKA